MLSLSCCSSTAQKHVDSVESAFLDAREPREVASDSKDQTDHLDLPVFDSALELVVEIETLDDGQISDADLCNPDCEGKQCGPDGCDGICGQCVGEQDECIDGACVCVPACLNAECGDDGCMGLCGECEEVDLCLDGICKPLPYVEKVIIISGNDGLGPRNMALTDSAGVFVSGDFYGTSLKFGEQDSIPVDEGEHGFFVAKMTSEWKFDWLVAPGAGPKSMGTYDSVCLGVDSSVVVLENFHDEDVDFGGGIVPASSFSEDIFVARLASDGTHVWSKSLAGPGTDFKSALACSATGDVYLTGGFGGNASPDFGDGPLEVPYNYDENAFLVKLDHAGTPQWSKTLVDLAPNVALSVSAGPDISVFWAVRVNKGNINLGGDDLIKQGTNDLLLGSFNEDGSHRWSKRYSPGLFDAVSAVGSDGSVLLFSRWGAGVDLGCGPVQPDPDNSAVSVAAKLDKDGNCVWSKNLLLDAVPASPDDELDLIINSVAFDAEGGLYVVGSFVASQLDLGSGPMAGDGHRNAVVAKFKPDGKVIWSFALQSGEDYAVANVASVVVGADGAVYLLGTFNSPTIQIGEETYENQGDGLSPQGWPLPNLFLVKLIG